MMAGSQSTKLLGLSKVDSIRHFKYQGGEGFVDNEEDEAQLEKEIEAAL